MPTAVTTAPDIGARGLARFVWRQLTSMRTALFLLLLLAVAAVPGSVVPQRGINPAAVTQYLDDHAQLGPWLDRFGFFDVYAAPWFSAIYLLLFISLVGCVLPRARVHLAAVRARPPRTPARLDRLPAYHRSEVDADPDQVLEAARAALRSQRFRVDLRTDSVAAERGYLRETGNLVFHLSLVGLLVAVAAGSLFSYRGEVLVTVGQGFSNVLADYDSFDPGTRFDPADLPPFRFTLDSLDVTFETEAAGNQFGAPRDFTAELTVVDRPDNPPRTATIKVNEPLAIGGANVYLSGNGYAPVVTVRDGNGDVALSGPVPFLPQDANYSSVGVLKVPDAAPEQIGVQAFLLPTAVVDPQRGPISVFPDAGDPRLFLTAYTGDLGLDGGRPQSVYRLDTTNLTQLTTPSGTPFNAALRPGESVDLPGGAGSITFDRLERFAALDVRADPSKGYVLVFAVLAIAGLVGSLFVPRRRVWVRVRPAAGSGEAPRTVVEVGALARGDDPGLTDQVDQVLLRLAGTTTRAGGAG